MGCCLRTSGSAMLSTLCRSYCWYIWDMWILKSSYETCNIHVHHWLLQRIIIRHYFFNSDTRTHFNSFVTTVLKTGTNMDDFKMLQETVTQKVCLTLESRMFWLPQTLFILAIFLATCDKMGAEPNWKIYRKCKRDHTLGCRMFSKDTCVWTNCSWQVNFNLGVEDVLEGHSYLGWLTTHRWTALPWSVEWPGCRSRPSIRRTQTSWRGAAASWRATWPSPWSSSPPHPAGRCKPWRRASPATQTSVAPSYKHNHTHSYISAEGRCYISAEGSCYASAEGRCYTGADGTYCSTVLR